MRVFRVLTYAVIALIVVYLIWIVAFKKNYGVGEEGMRGSYQRLITLNRLRDDWKVLKCSVDLNQSLAQDVHIVRDLSGTFCAEELRGEEYDNLKKPFSCSSEDAAKIDEAVRKNGSCAFPIGTPLSDNVSDYHAMVLVCVADLTNWTYVGGGLCPSESPQSIVYAVVDANGNVFY